jgi:hypothetical protein
MQGVRCAAHIAARYGRLDPAGRIHEVFTWVCDTGMCQTNPLRQPLPTA